MSISLGDFNRALNVLLVSVKTCFDASINVFCVVSKLKDKCNVLKRDTWGSTVEACVCEVLPLRENW